MTQDQQKHITISLYGGQSNYEWLQRSKQLPQFNKSPLYYSMLPEQRLANDVQNLTLLIKLFRQGALKPQILKYISVQLFGPAFTLITHNDYFYKTITSHAKQNLLAKLKQDVEQMRVIGGVLNETMYTNVKQGHRPQLARKSNGYYIQMPEECLYYSSSTNIFMDVAVAFAVRNGKQIPVFVRLRDQNKNLMENVKTKYIGQTISPQHFLIGYNLNNYFLKQEDILTQNWTDQALLKNRTDWDFTLFQLSLLDLYKACDIVVRYTGMRRQFKTITNSKQERKIGQYQAVASRIADAISTSHCMSALYNRMLSTEVRKSLFAPYIQYAHHGILERIIHLRECCGGYGYIKWSGMPQLIERVSYRASLNRRDAPMPVNKDLLVSFMYFSSSPQILNQFKDPKTTKTQFSHFSIMSLNKRMWAQSQTQDIQQNYLFDFVKHSALQVLYGQQRGNTLKSPDYYKQCLINYLSSTYTLNNAEWIGWNYVQGKRQQFVDRLINSRTTQIAFIGERLHQFAKQYCLTQYNDVIVGRQNETEFYDEVIRYSKANRRNAPDFQQYVKRPVIDFLNETNGPKL